MSRPRVRTGRPAARTDSDEQQLGAVGAVSYTHLVRVVLHEVPPTHFAAGDVTLAERAAVSAPVADGSASDPAGPAAAADDASRPDGIPDRAVEATTHEQEPRA